jgi:hypothetical protein
MFRRIYLCRTLATSLELTYLKPVPGIHLRMVAFVILPIRRKSDLGNDRNISKRKKKRKHGHVACLLAS